MIENRMVFDEDDDYGIAGFSLSLIGFLTSFFIVGIVLDILGIITSSIQLSKKSTGFGITGLTLSVVSLLISIAMIVFVVINFESVIKYFS